MVLLHTWRCDFYNKCPAASGSTIKKRQPSLELCILQKYSLAYGSFTYMALWLLMIIRNRKRLLKKLRYFWKYSSFSKAGRSRQHFCDIISKCLAAPEVPVTPTTSLIPAVPEKTIRVLRRSGLFSVVSGVQTQKKPVSWQVFILYHIFPVWSRLF